MSNTNFQSLRSQLHQSRSTFQSGKDELFLAREKQKRIGAQQASLNRYFDPKNEAHLARDAALKKQYKQITEQISGLQSRIGILREGFSSNLEAFLPLTDPRDRIEELNDVFPILLLPLRIETRFKRFSSQEGSFHQLWVRVYPDDCAIDTFEAALSEDEVNNAQKYWAQVWRAGDDDLILRAAWRNLVASHGAGRAMWIEQNYRPINEDEQPDPAPQSVLLVIATDNPLDGTGEAIVSTYWTAIWKAGEDASAIQTAQNALISEFGAEFAETINKDYQPINLDEAVPVGLTRATTTVFVAYVKFPSAEETDTKRHEWSQAPRVNVMPERLILQGYNDDKLTLEEISNPIPGTLIVGPDPLAEEGEQIRQDGADVALSDDMRWMVDFEEAITKGMAFRVNLKPEQYERGFDKLIVLGVRLSSDESVGQELIENLLANHHFGRTTLSLLKQGTPTNNTDHKASGYTETEDADEAYDALKSDNGVFEANNADWFDRNDGQWLSHLLGIDTPIMGNIPGARHTDISDAQAMNTALFPGTIGYTLDTMLASIFDDYAIEFVREFYTHLVSGRGLLPALRIGQQPYGILASTVYSRMNFGRFHDDVDAPIGILGRSNVGSPYLAKLYEVLMRAYGVWGTLKNRVAHVGDSDDPHQTLLEILGLHATSVEFDQRYAESLQQLLNTMNLQGGLAIFISALTLLEQGQDVLRDHGYDLQKNERPDLLEKFFFAKPIAIDEQKLIDDQPLSEQKSIRAYTEDGRNYIQWLKDAATTSLETLRTQSGLTTDDRPGTLLYLMLRHALMLGYYDSGVRLYERADILQPNQLLALRREAPFIHVKEEAESSESRFKILYESNAAVTDGQAGVKVADYITANMINLNIVTPLPAQISALEKLQNRSTAELERVFVEHIDTCSYRLDSWMQGLVNYQLAVMRYTGVEDMTARRGLYVGAYGWLENLKPDEDSLSQIQLKDDGLVEVFQRDEDLPLMRDTNNAGYIHAPSLNHAVTAAVLRNAYISTADEDDAEVFAVNLSSERVRRAMAVIEGLRNGQSIAALLGYQLERGLHDRHALAEVDQYIYVLRDQFSLVANRINETKTTDNTSISEIEARNVVNGEALVNHIENANPKTYPYGIDDLPAPGTTAATVIDAELRRLLDTNDAVADLGLAEGIHQVVQGNYDRAAATLDSLSNDTLPPLPDVVSTPRSGSGLTLRVGLHLKPGLSLTASPVAGLAMTARASAEPAINDWLSQILPDPDQVEVTVQLTTRDGTESTGTISQKTLGLQPIDLLYMLIPENEQAMTDLDDLILREAKQGLAIDTKVTILYTQSVAPKFSLFEVGALINQLRPLLLESRPLRATDIAIANESKTAQVNLPEYHVNRIEQVINNLNAAGSGLSTVRNLEATLMPILDDTEANLTNIVNNIDSHLTAYIDALADLSVYGLPQTGFGTAIIWRQSRYIALLDKVRDLLQRWQSKLDAFDTMLTEYGLIDPQTEDEVRFEMLQDIEKQVAIVLTPLLPADTPATYQAQLPGRRQAFVLKMTEFTDILAAPPAPLAALLNAIENASQNLEDFDFIRLKLSEDEQEIVRYSQDILAHIQQLIIDTDERILTAGDELANYAAASTADARSNAFTLAARALLSSDFVVIPEFTIPAEQADEIEKAYNARTTLLKHQTDTLSNDFPVDEWLYGIARVRDMLHHLESLMMLTEATQNLSLDLHPLQLPFMEDDSWLALPYPSNYVIDRDKLLYTAHFAEAFNKNALQCGLLLDEWTEVIPTTEETTGIAFHYDRPNAEPPQVMLLAVPPVINGKWEWADLVDTIHETFELAQRRAIEPDHIAGTSYGRYLPATISAVTRYPLTIMMNYALVNNVYSIISNESESNDG